MSWIILTFVVGVVNLILGYEIAVLLGHGPPSLRDAWAAAGGRKWPSPQADDALLDALVHNQAAEAEEPEKAAAPAPMPPEASLRDVVLSLRTELPKNEAKLIDVDTTLRSTEPSTLETNMAQAQALEADCRDYLEDLGKRSAEIQSQLGSLGQFKAIGQQIDMALVEQSAQFDATVRNLAQHDLTGEPASVAGYLKGEVVSLLGLMHHLRDYLATTFMDIIWQDKRLRTTDESQTMDALTEVPNRIGFELALQERWEQNRFRDQAHSAILFDVDALVELNQQHGVAAGKHVLRTLVQRIRECQGAPDAIFRFSGQQFVLLLPAEGGPALQIARRISETLQAGSIPFGKALIPVSVTGAVVQILPTSTPRDILARFEDALATAKRIARGRVYLADKAKAPPQMFKPE